MPPPPPAPQRRDRLPGQNLPRVPRPLSSSELPKKYKPAERRVRTVIIALPIAVVTSWVLWKRLALGEERKKLNVAPPAEGILVVPGAEEVKRGR